MGQSLDRLDKNSIYCTAETVAELKAKQETAMLHVSSIMDQRIFAYPEETLFFLRALRERAIPCSLFDAVSYVNILAQQHVITRDNHPIRAGTMHTILVSPWDLLHVILADPHAHYYFSPAIEALNKAEFRCRVTYCGSEIIRYMSQETAIGYIYGLTPAPPPPVCTAGVEIGFYFEGETVWFNLNNPGYIEYCTVPRTDFLYTIEIKRTIDGNTSKQTVNYQTTDFITAMTNMFRIKDEDYSINYYPREVKPALPAKKTGKKATFAH